jgi:hypothetical protein
MLRLDPIEGGNAETAAPVLKQRVGVGIEGESVGLGMHAADMGRERRHCTLSDEAEHIRIGASFEFFAL